MKFVENNNIPVKAKICGIKNIDDALTAVNYGADALGFIFAESPRKMTPEAVREIIRQLPPFVTTVGVFVDSPAEAVNDIASYTGINVVQLHGNESPEYCREIKYPIIKGIRVKNEDSLKLLEEYQGIVKAFLLDTYVVGIHGGTGKTFNWQLVPKAKEFGPVILAGGLKPSNISEAIQACHPYGVDVSSGVETEGRKDKLKIKEFIQKVRGN